MNFKLNACDCLFNLQVLKVIDAVLVLFSHLKIEIEYCSWLFLNICCEVLCSKMLIIYRLKQADNL